MKKYFIFAAIATAGLFASCSSSDDIAANDVQNPIEDSEAREAIRLNLATPTVMTTRGTGTVGGVGENNSASHYSANVWAGQSINVFMFTKGTGSAAVYYTTVDEYNTAKNTSLTEEQFNALTDDEKIKTPATVAGATTLNLTPAHEPGANTTTYLYDDEEMITPGSSKNLIPGENTDADGSGEAMIKDGTINYYPPTGNFDFFGYHVDGANGTAEVDKATAATTLWTIPFTIDGTQDLMSTKAELTTEQAATMTGTGTTPNTRANDYYSAYAARKGVHPTLTFKHLLSRFQFSVVAGNDAAAGLVGGSAAVNYTQAEAEAYNANLTDGLKPTDVGYSFTSGPANNTPAADQWSVTGVVKVMGTVVKSSETYTIIYVIQNNSNNPVDLSTFYHHAFAMKGATVGDVDFTGDGAQLYVATATNDTYTIDDNVVAGVYIKNVTLLDAAAKVAYNAALDGSVSTATVKTPATDPHVDALQAVKVTSIKVLSANTKGKLAVAWTAADMTDPQKITWDAAADQPSDVITATPNRWLTLMDRPAYKKKDGAVAAEVTDFTDLTTQKTAYEAQKALLDPTDDAALIAELNTKIGALSTTATNRETAQITAEMYALLTDAAKAAKYEEIENPANENLIALTPTSPAIDNTKTTKPDRYPSTQVGESIILSPGAYNADGVAQTGTAATENLRMIVTLAQNVPTNWNHPDILTEKTQEYELSIPAPYLSGNSGDKGFKQNYSYNVILTVYGLERIEVITVVKPWTDGGNIEVGADD